MLASVGLTLKVHLLPPTPDRSAIDVAEAFATMNGTPARSTSGMIASATELHRPSKMAAYFFSESICVTLFTASAGLQRLSWKSISILRPSAPPLALASATAISAPQRACWPKCATPPVSGVDAPMMIGPVWACANPVIPEHERRHNTQTHLLILTSIDDCAIDRLEIILASGHVRPACLELSLAAALLGSASSK